jgi:hypothetical protein
LKALKAALIKPIHQFALRQLNLGLNTNLLYCPPSDCGVEWSLQNIIRENETVERDMLKQKMEDSSNFEQFFLLIEDYLLDCCIRRLDIT